MELPHLLGTALDLSKAMGITPELQMAIQDVITRVQVELDVNG